jgi:hypothetical protein
VICNRSDTLVVFAPLMAQNYSESPLPAELHGGVLNTSTEFS